MDFAVWVCNHVLLVPGLKRYSVHHKSNWLSSLHWGFSPVMFTAVITQCSKGAYDKGRHYRAAECLSQLRILSQTEPESRSTATWQHWTLKVLLQVKLHNTEQVVANFHCTLEAFQKLCLQIFTQQLHFVSLSLALFNWRLHIINIDFFYIISNNSNNNQWLVSTVFHIGLSHIVQALLAFRAFWNICVAVFLTLSALVMTAESSFFELKIIYYKQFEHHHGTRDAEWICQMVSWEQKLDLGHTWWLCIVHGSGDLQTGA